MHTHWRNCLSVTSRSHRNYRITSIKATSELSVQYGDCFVLAYASCLPRMRGRIFSISLFFFLTDANADERNKIDTSEEHSRDLHARHREREFIWCAKRGREFDIARNESFQLGRTSSERHTHTHTHIILFSLYLLSFGFFYCVIYALCLSIRAHHIESLIVRPTKKSEKSSIWKTKLFYLSQQ